MRISKIVWMAMVVALLAGCRSSRRAEKQQSALSSEVQTGVGGLVGDSTGTSVAGQDSDSDKKSVSAQRNTTVEALSAKMDINLRQGNKTIHCTGTYRVKRGEVVQLNLVYTVLIMPVNVGTLELTPDGLLVIDRMGKRYCRVAFSDIGQLQKYGVNYELLESLFWGDAGDIDTNVVGCTYDSWTNLSQGRFPQGITISLKSGKQTASANIQLSNIKETGDWDYPTKVSGKYTQVTPDQVMNAIIGAAK